MISTCYNAKISFFYTNREISLGGKFDDLMAKHGIIIERSAPATQAQNGAAERSGGVIMTKARTMRIAARLPLNL